MKYRIAVILFLCITIINCDRNNALIEVLKDINEKVNYIPLKGWSNEQRINDEEFEYYYLHNDKTDTIYDLRLEIKVDRSFDVSAKYNITWFHKFYINNDYRVNQIIDHDKTIVYRENLRSDEKEFEVGIYYYMFLFPKELYQLGYDKRHYNYILERIDSLAFVRGNILDFPEFEPYTEKY